MNITGLGTDRLRLKLRIMSDDELWRLLLDHPHQCLHEFWEKCWLEKPLVPYPRTVRSGLSETPGDVFRPEALTTIAT